MVAVTTFGEVQNRFFGNDVAPGRLCVAAPDRTEIFRRVDGRGAILAGSPFIFSAFYRNIAAVYFDQRGFVDESGRKRFVFIPLPVLFKRDKYILRGDFVFHAADPVHAIIRHGRKHFARPQKFFHRGRFDQRLVRGDGRGVVLRRVAGRDALSRLCGRRQRRQRALPRIPGRLRAHRRRGGISRTVARGKGEKHGKDQKRRRRGFGYSGGKAHHLP